MLPSFSRTRDCTRRASCSSQSVFRSIHVPLTGRDTPWKRFPFFPRLFLLTHRRWWFNGNEDTTDARRASSTGWAPLREMSHDESEIYARLLREQTNFPRSSFSVGCPSIARGGGLQCQRRAKQHPPSNTPRHRRRIVARSVLESRESRYVALN